MKDYGMRGYVVGQGYVGTGGATKKEKASFGRMLVKRRARAEFWKKYKETHPGQSK